MNAVLVVITIFLTVSYFILGIKYFRSKTLDEDLLPAWAQMIITEEMFETIVQIWFEGIKDILDDKGNKYEREDEND